jgi:hypothetical protein
LARLSGAEASPSSGGTGNSAKIVLTVLGRPDIGVLEKIGHSQRYLDPQWVCSVLEKCQWVTRRGNELPVESHGQVQFFKSGFLTDRLVTFVL